MLQLHAVLSPGRIRSSPAMRADDDSTFSALKGESYEHRRDARIPGRIAGRKVDLRRGSPKTLASCRRILFRRFGKRRGNILNARWQDACREDDFPSVA